MSARRSAPATTLELLAPPLSAPRPRRRINPHEVIDLTVRADNRLLLTVDEAAERLGVGRTLMYELLGSGDIESVRLGRLRRIAPQALSNYVAALHARD